MAKVCTYPNCERGCYGEFCLMHKPRKAIITKAKLKPIEIECEGCKSRFHYTSMCPYKSKRISPKGRVGSRWSACKKLWYKTYGTDFPCHYCGLRLNAETITLDHLIPRSRAPQLRYNFNNLVPCCYQCNGLKGSVAHDDYVHECH